MKTEFAQVFELSVTEKLQLLEDLWDSIAQNPEKLPVLDWQKEALDQRKVNYLKILILVVAGTLLKKEFAIGSMTLNNLIVLPEAEEDITQSYAW